MSDPLIKKASIQDTDTIFNIVRESSKWMKEKYGYTHWEEYYTRDKIEKNIDNKNVYILYEENTPVATYSVGEIPADYYTDEHINCFKKPKERAYYPTTITVLPKYQGKGYAKMLIKHLEDLSKENDIKYIRFDARGDYKELINFYQKQGFSIVGEMRDDDEIYYLFEKEIARN